MLRRSLLFVVVAAAVLAPAAYAAKAPRVRLPQLPLQQAALGSEGTSLQLQWQDSGPVDNSTAAGDSYGFVDPKALKKLGRVAGYELDYGDPYSGGFGVNEIRTNVDEYKTAPDAARGLAFWRKDDRKIVSQSQSTLTITAGALKAKKVGSGTFAFLITESARNLSPLYFVDEQATEGRYVLDAYVAAGTKSAALQAAPALARKLDSQIRQAVAGRLHTKAVQIPFPPDSAQPPGGPDLATLIIQPSDVGQSQAQNILQGYDAVPYAISDYSLLLEPAGPFDAAFQEVGWYPTAGEATEIAAYGVSGFSGLTQLATLPALSVTVTPVDVSSVGDNAVAEVVDLGSGGGYFASITLTKGQIVDNLVVLSSSASDPSVIQNLAQVAANRLDAGYSG